MSKPLEKIKKIRSLNEVITRSGQALSVYREQRSGGAGVPSDAEFFRLIDKSQFGSVPIVAETIWQKFYKNGEERFFLSFSEPEQSIQIFKQRFGSGVTDKFINSAESIVEGRIDLMGLKSLYVGSEIDWHREPLSAKRSPLKHWKLFDELDSAETGNKKIVWELNRHQHFFTLGVAYWLTGESRFARTFVRHLESWMNDNPPGLGINWASSLEVSFRAISWIWALQFFKNADELTPEIFNHALKFLYLHGRHIERYLSTYYSPNTHLTGEALGLYYLGTQLPFIERAAHWRRLSSDILHSEIAKQVHADGVYFEQSTWYQRYTADIFAHFVVLASLYGGSAEHNSAMLQTRLEKCFDFMMHATMPDGRTPIIGDDDGGRILPLTFSKSDDFRGTLSLGAVLFERPDYKFVAGPPGQEIFWVMGPDSLKYYDAISEAEPEAGSSDFSHGGYSVMRDGWSDTDNFLIVDCGEVGSLAGGHGHADALSIEVAMHGKPLLVDSGTYTYHETRELRDYFRSTNAHNTLVIDGVSSSVPGGPFAWKSRAAASLKTWISDVRFDYFEGSHDGYQRLDEPATHTRSILFIKNDYWIIRDVVETSGLHEYSLNFHFDDNVTTGIGDRGRWVGGDGHRLFTFGDNGSWEQKESWISKNHGNRTNAPFMRFVSTGNGKQEFFTFLLPVETGVMPPEVSEITMAGGRAFVISYGGYSDIFVLNDEAGVTVENGLFGSDFEYSWARLGTGEAVPEEFILINGSRLVIAENEVFSGNATHASLRRLGSELYIRTDKETSKFELRFVDRRKDERRRPNSDRRQGQK